MLFGDVDTNNVYGSFHVLKGFGWMGMVVGILFAEDLDDLDVYVVDDGKLSDSVVLRIGVMFCVRCLLTRG